MVEIGPGAQRTQLPEGFLAFSINSGVRKYRPDLGVIFSKFPSVAVATFTANTCHSAHVHYDMKILPSQNLQAIVTNSGHANTATGRRGQEDNQKMVNAVAEQLGIASTQVASASTGVIGIPMDIDKILSAMPDLFNSKSAYAEGFATAIMTTDLVPKTFTTLVKLSGGEIRITGICKGSGMIHPNMATMLGYIMTDVKVAAEWAQEHLRLIVDESFNMISVDGETSPNDTVFLMANGASGVSPRNETDFALLNEGLLSVARHMAKSIARDGEGASKLIEVKVSGMSDLSLARKVARGIVTSPLVKTAVHGGDPNWGRIYSRIGQEGVPYELVSKMRLYIGDVLILQDGNPVPIDYYKVRKNMNEDEVFITVDFHSGNQVAISWGCDLTKKYVDINTEYN